MEQEATPIMYLEQSPMTWFNSSDNVIHIDFYDKDRKVIDSSDTEIKDMDGNILGSIDVNKKDVSKVSLQLKDDDNVLYNVDSDNIIEQ